MPDGRKAESGQNGVGVAPWCNGRRRAGVVDRVGVAPSSFFFWGLWGSDKIEWIGGGVSPSSGIFGVDLKPAPSPGPGLKGSWCERGVIEVTYDEREEEEMR